MAAVGKVLECMPQMVAMCAESGRIKYANKKWERYRGKQEEEEWMNIVHPLDQNETKGKWEEHVKSADGSFEITHRLRNSEGEYRYEHSFVLF
jgi:PAS domain S-box-containing protein